MNGRLVNRTGLSDGAEIVAVPYRLRRGGNHDVGVVSI